MNKNPSLIILLSLFSIILSVNSTAEEIPPSEHEAVLKYLKNGYEANREILDTLQTNIIIETLSRSNPGESTILQSEQTLEVDLYLKGDYGRYDQKVLSHIQTDLNGRTNDIADTRPDSFSRTSWDTKKVRTVDPTRLGSYVETDEKDQFLAAYMRHINPLSRSRVDYEKLIARESDLAIRKEDKKYIINLTSTRQDTRGYAYVEWRIDTEKGFNMISHKIWEKRPDFEDMILLRTSEFAYKKFDNYWLATEITSTNYRSDGSLRSKTNLMVDTWATSVNEPVADKIFTMATMGIPPKQSAAEKLRQKLFGIGRLKLSKIPPSYLKLGSYAFVALAAFAGIIYILKSKQRSS